MSRKYGMWVLVLLAFAAAAGPLAATQVKIFQTQSPAGFLAGTLEGVSVDALGRVSLAPRIDKVASLAEPFLFSAAALPDGWVVGSGNAGKVLKVDRKGKVSELFSVPEPEIFAVWADPDGTVYAGSSPNGKVYRQAAKAAGSGKAEVYFEPGETYIWALGRGADGKLLVATGTQGKLFQVEAAGRGKVLYDSEDTHVRTLLVRPGGDVVMGTAGDGLVLVLSQDGSVRTLYDASQPEVVALSGSPDGALFVAVIASEASLVDTAKSSAEAAAAAAVAEAVKGEAAAGGGGSPKVTVTVEDPPAPAGGRRGADGGNRSEILRLSPNGVVEKIWSSAEETVYALLWQRTGLWIGTGLEGKLYRWDGTQTFLEKDLDDRQVVDLLPPGEGDTSPALVTTNASALFHMSAERETKGTYTSAALDAGQVARFGTFRWQGETPGRSSARFSFRSGNSAEPDRTWSPWSNPAPAVLPGDEIALGSLPRGRYVQWRVELASGGESALPVLFLSELSYRQENQKPRIDAFAALDAGQVLVPQNFNPGNQIYEPAHPNREGIFNTLDAATAGDEGGRVKGLWKKGFRTLRWSTSDPNDDRLVETLAFRPAAAAESAGWLAMAGDLKEDYYSFDATVLPDGLYRFRLSVSDAEANDPESALTAEQVSDPVLIDHTPPRLGDVSVQGDTLRVEVKDALSPLREVVYSVDAGEWKPARAADGLLDGRSETLLVEAPAKGSHLLLLRASDAAFNDVTFDLSSRR